MPREWTAAQSAAISTKDKNLLISAAAGSGKTATLTERIIRSLTDPSAPRDISKMLVVTFTRAAATELKQRISAAIGEAIASDPQNKHLSMQLVKIASAKICTIDSFYLELIRENFSSLSLPPAFRIADTAESELLSKEIMEDTVNEFYDSDFDGFSHLAESFSSTKSLSRLSDVFLNLYSHISSYPEGKEFLKISSENCTSGADEDFFASSFGKILKESTLDTVNYLIDIVSKTLQSLSEDKNLTETYLSTFSQYNDYLCELRQKLDTEGYIQTRECLLRMPELRLKSYKGETSLDIADTAQRRKKVVSDTLKALRDRSFALPCESISEAMRETGHITMQLYELISVFENKFTEEKLRRGMCDFNDIRRYALKLLVNPDGTPTDIAAKLSEKYTDIYIDEYQDVDRVQDMIFAAISNGHNRFMVGDIKQSIYSFRGAEPQVFASYRTSFPDISSDAANNSQSNSIFMSNNFRCDENIIKFTNTVCSYLFEACADSSVYTKADDLIFSKLSPTENYVSPKVSLKIITPSDNEDSEYISNSKSNKLAEARIAAKEISDLICFGKKANGDRIRAGDIAILLRSSSIKPFLKQALTEKGIPFCGEGEGSYFEDPDVLLVLSVLNIIDNPYRDIYMAGTLLSKLFAFSLDELIVLRKSADTNMSLYEALEKYAEENQNELSEKSEAFITTLLSWRTMAVSLPVDKLIKHIYSEESFSCLGLSNSKKLKLLYENARKFESGAFRGLYNFIEYINNLISEGKTFDVGGEDSSPDKVSLMTIHHSKGLEFPVCFICGTSSQFNRREFTESMLFEYSAGAAMKLADKTGFARINTPMREAIASKILAKQTEEEMRVLYVALTRAREYLYVTASVTKSRDKLLAEAWNRHDDIGKNVIHKCHSYLEWILTALRSSEYSDFCKMDFIPADTVCLSSNIKLNKESLLPSVNCEKSIQNTELIDKLRKDFAFKYPFSSLSRIPAKIAVSRLTPDILDESDDTFDIFEKAKKASVPRILEGNTKKEFSATDRGTMTHLFFQFCDFEYAEKHGAEEELGRLIEKRFIPSYATDAVFVNDLNAFFDSELYKRIKCAKKIIREQRFNILLPPAMFSKDSDFLKNADGEQLAVQGVIDLVIIDANGDISLYDYKTDRIFGAERYNDDLLKKQMQQRHSEQLDYYKIAVERLFGKACKSVGIYSTHTAKLVEW